MERIALTAQAVVERIGDAAAWLVAAVVLLLFLQIPLREVFATGNGLANDMGQLAHAAAVVCGIALAQGRGLHVRVDLFARNWRERTRAWMTIAGTLLFVLPWMGVVAYFGWGPVRRSFAAFERFPEQFSPGYFLLKGTILALAALVALQSIADLARAIAVLRTRR